MLNRRLIVLVHFLHLRFSTSNLRTFPYFWWTLDSNDSWSQNIRRWRIYVNQYGYMKFSFIERNSQQILFWQLYINYIVLIPVSSYRFKNSNFKSSPLIDRLNSTNELTSFESMSRCRPSWPRLESGVYPHVRISTHTIITMSIVSNHKHHVIELTCAVALLSVQA